MSVSSQPEIDLAVTANAGVEVKKFMDAEGVTVKTDTGEHVVPIAVASLMYVRAG